MFWFKLCRLRIFFYPLEIVCRGETQLQVGEKLFNVVLMRDNSYENNDIPQTNFKPVFNFTKTTKSLLSLAVNNSNSFQTITSPEGEIRLVYLGNSIMIASFQVHKVILSNV